MYTLFQKKYTPDFLWSKISFFMKPSWKEVASELFHNLLNWLQWCKGFAIPFCHLYFRPYKNDRPIANYLGLFLLTERNVIDYTLKIRPPEHFHWITILTRIQLILAKPYSHPYTQLFQEYAQPCLGPYTAHSKILA